MQPPLTADHAGRRARVVEALGAAGALVLVASPELRVGRDGEVRYAADADLLYLTGCTEPGAVFVLLPGGGSTLFVRPRDPAHELWHGRRGGVEAVVERYGIDEGADVAELDSRLPDLLRDVDTLYARPGDAPLDRMLGPVLRDGRARRARTGRGVVRLHEPGLILDELRLVKDAAEIAALRAAAEVTVAGFRDALAVVRPGAGEWQVEAALESGFRRRGALGPAFPSIVAGGANATVLHYTANAAPLAAGALLLIDAGARVAHYCGDVSRTVPVSGRFTPVQRRMYDLVLGAHDAAIAAVRPGASFAAVHDAAVAVLREGLAGEGLLPEGEVAEGAPDPLGRFFPHRTSHWLGLDVHDVGDYAVGDRPRTLRTGMVLTVEPGLYFPDAEDVPAELRGTGIRIEDDVLVSATASEVLTAALPAHAEAIEGLVGGNG